MVIIRLRRTGKRKEPHFRLIVSDSRKDTTGTYLEAVGYYNPRQQPAMIELNRERIQYWLSKGAQASDTVHNLLVDAKLLDTPKRAVGAKKAAKAAETAPEASPAT